MATPHFTKLTAVLLLCAGLSACLQRSIILPHQAPQEILTRKQGGNCGKGENVFVTTKDGHKRRMYVCEISADFIVECPVLRFPFFKAPDERIALADVAQIERVRSTLPCWLRGPTGGSIRVL